MVCGHAQHERVSRDHRQSTETEFRRRLTRRARMAPEYRLVAERTVRMVRDGGE
jgi:hypothetical protein